MKNILKLFVLTIVLFTTTLLHAKKNDLENISVQLKWFYQFQFAGILVAKEKGFYEEAGLNVTIKERDPSKNNILQVLEGDSEYGLADAAILRYRADGYPIKVFATIFQHNAMVLIAKKESGIVSPYEMKGKNLSFQKGLDDSIVQSLLSFAGLSEDDYIKKPMDFTHMNFVEGNVDVSEAYISIEPYWMKKKYGIELNIIDPKNYGIDIYGDLLFTTEKEIKEHPERVEAFKEATLKGWAYALEHKDEAIQIILDKYNTRNLEYEQLLYEARITENLIASKYIPLGEVRKVRFETLAKIYERKKISKQKLQDAVDNIIYNPHAKTNIFAKYASIIIGILAIAIILVFILIYINSRLQALVKKKTKELEIAKQKAERAAEAKSIFLANMSHEIRTPMNAILGFVEQLQKEEHDPKRLEVFNIVHTSGNTLISIINDILDISKIQNDKMQLNIQAHNLHEVCTELQELFKQNMRNSNKLFEVHIDPYMPKCCMVDDLRLKQIMINLVGNAIKFTEDDGYVGLSVNYNEEQKKITIIVEDDGVGIAEENFEKIFTIFEQEDNSTTKQFGGTGLGLAISKKLIELMNGSIYLESEVGKGSHFYVTLPYVACKDEEQLLQKRIDENAEIDTDTHIMIVEDNKTNQLLLSMILDELELSYSIANDGVEAIELYKSAQEFDLIFMDENMPNMNGIEAVKAIRKLEKDQMRQKTPIIAVTANALEGDEARFLHAGMDAYIAKPYKETQITQILIQYLSK